MLDTLKTESQAFRDATAGQRFVQHHERYARRNPAWKALCFFVAIFVTGMAVTLPFVGGFELQAWIFAALAIVLLPGESRAFAQLLDRLEALVRRQPMPQAAAPEVRETTRLERAAIERALRMAAERQPAPPAQYAPAPRAPAAIDLRSVQPKQQPTAANAMPAVRTVQPITVVDRPKSDARVRARVVRRPRIAGTVKMWSAGEQAPDGSPKLTIVVFPPRIDEH